MGPSYAGFAIVSLLIATGKAQASKWHKIPGVRGLAPGPFLVAQALFAQAVRQQVKPQNKAQQC